MKNFLYKAILLVMGIITYGQQPTEIELIHSPEMQQMHSENVLLNILTVNTGTLITQMGNENVISLDTEEIKVNQKGEYQLLFYTETSKLDPSSLNINMQGTNNYIEIFGNNTIMENMTVNMSGNDRSLIIRNYR